MIEAVHLYPTTMNTYGDRGNVAALTRRAALRDIDVRWHAVELGDQPPKGCDIIFMGGGQDRIQHAIADDLHRLRDWLETRVADGSVVFGVCAGLQLLGHRYVAADGSVVKGIGVFDLETVAAQADEWRLIGNVVVDVETDSGPQVLAGFENHGGRTWLGTGVRPLGQVRYGHGNNGRDGGEGVRSGSLLATYLHGPVLPKNAWLTDHLLELAGAHAGGPASLPPLDRRREDEARAEAIRAAERDHRARHSLVARTTRRLPRRRRS